MKALWTTGTIAALALFFVSAFRDSWQGVAAVAIGLVGTAVFLTGTWFVVRLTGDAARAGLASPRQAVVTALFLLLKLPLIYAGWVLAGRLGPFGPTWFLLGLALVYCLTVWRAVLAVRT